MPVNELYLVVLPMVHLGISHGATEQVLTLLPNKDLATEFFADEVEAYIGIFEPRANRYLIGGHVKGYTFERQPTPSGRFIVKVTQNVG